MGLLQALGLPEITAPTATSAVAPTVGSSAGSTPAGAAQKSAFAAARVAASALIDALKAHPQTASIQVLITQAGAKLAIADAHAAKSEWPQAMQALEDVKAIAATAKKAADDRQGFTIKLADITSGMNAFQNFGGNSTFTLLSNAIANANAQAAANNDVAANQTLDAAAVQLQLALKAWVDTVKSMLVTSTANASVALFLKPEIDKASCRSQPR